MVHLSNAPPPPRSCLSCICHRAVVIFLQHSPDLVDSAPHGAAGLTALHAAARHNQLTVAKVIVQQVSFLKPGSMPQSYKYNDFDLMVHAVKNRRKSFNFPSLTRRWISVRFLFISEAIWMPYVADFGKISGHGWCGMTLHLSALSESFAWLFTKICTCSSHDVLISDHVCSSKVT